MIKNQLELGFEKLKPIELPNTKLNLVEQFSYALQNRDAIGISQLMDDSDTDPRWGNKEGFISKFIGFCNQMDKKYQGVYVYTVPGQCGEKHCNKGLQGLGVTLNTIRDNKLLWRFNLVFKESTPGKVNLWLCKRFEVNHEDIPF